MRERCRSAPSLIGDETSKMHRSLIAVARAARGGARSFHYASPAYLSAFTPAVSADPSAIRSSALQALASADKIKASWKEEPVTSLLAGAALTGGATAETRDAFGLGNGSQLLATPSQVQALLEHAAAQRRHVQQRHSVFAGGGGVLQQRLQVLRPVAVVAAATAPPPASSSTSPRPPGSLTPLPSLSSSS